MIIRVYAFSDNYINKLNQLVMMINQNYWCDNAMLVAVTLQLTRLRAGARWLVELMARIAAVIA